MSKFLTKTKNKNFLNKFTDQSRTPDNKDNSSSFSETVDYLSILNDDELKPPDWRWLIAKGLVEGKIKILDIPKQSIKKLNEDEYLINTILLVSVLENLDKKKEGTKNRLNLKILNEKLKNYLCAWKLKFIFRDLSQEIEIRILGRENEYSISTKTSVDSDVILIYKKMFFDVDEKIENFVYINNCVIKFDSFPTIFNFYKLISYCCGYGIFENFNFINKINYNEFENTVKERIKQIGLVKLLSSGNKDVDKSKAFSGEMVGKEISVLLTKHFAENLNINQASFEQNNNLNINFINEIKDIIDQNPMYDVFLGGNGEEDKSRILIEKQSNNEILKQIDTQINQK